ncbi:uncharacterized protein DUF402 [Actinocorallia herbida]|uniref:Uncharacterized protein DUF402 n=2 Tax=Actinocorallia herbida TaxID=58109 RepID=A0A3N1D504_9ACTN|nr:uncharacterized protein DUF402 [Actinocorallia herbida]
MPGWGNVRRRIWFNPFMTMQQDPATVRFSPGQEILHRQFTGERLVYVRAVRVVAHDELGLRLWIPRNTPMSATMTSDGRGLRDMPFAEWVHVERELTPMRWTGPDIFMYTPPDSGHSVMFFWYPKDQFFGWYVNLEEPGVLWQDENAAGIDITDQDLDMWVNRDLSWSWKDEHELEERLNYPDHYWVADADAVRAEGLRVARQIEQGAFPFDGTWCDFRPDPSWDLPRDLPAGWDRPRVRG